jgi:hypothetical protein
MLLLSHAAAAAAAGSVVAPAPGCLPLQAWPSERARAQTPRTTSGSRGWHPGRCRQQQRNKLQMVCLISQSALSMVLCVGHQHGCC